MKTENVNVNHKDVFQYVTSILAFISLILLLLVVLICYFISLESSYSKTGFYDKVLDQYSIPCVNVSLSPDEDFSLFTIDKHKVVTFKEKHSYFCKFVNLTDLIPKFVDRIGRQRLATGKERKPYLQCGNTSLQPLSGHLTAFYTKISKQHYINKSHTEQPLHWDTEPKSSYISQSLHHHEGKIRVPEGRYYFVYAAIHVNLSSSPTETDINSRCTVWIRICTGTTQERERTVLYKSKYFNSKNMTTVTSLNIQGAVYLPKRENVFVKMSNIHTLISNSAGNVFGIYPLN